MLSYKYRFHGHNGLRYLYRTGKTARTRSFMLRFTPNEKRLTSRATVIVSKKTMKSAARRNRIRRRIYEVLREQWETLAPAYDMSITVFAPEVGLIPQEQLVRELEQLFTAARLYKKPSMHAKIERTE